VKIPLYMDVYRWQKEFFLASSNPSAKIEGMKRFRILVEIPDPVEVDQDAPVLEETEVDK